MTKSSARREQLTSRPAERQRFTKGPTMNDLTDEQRARALELYRLYPPVRVAPDHQETGTAHSRDDLMRWTYDPDAWVRLWRDDGGGGLGSTTRKPGSDVV